MRGNQVTARIDCALAGASVAQGTAEHAAGFAIDEAAIGDAIATAVGHAIEGLAGGVGGDAQGGGGDGADGTADRRAGQGVVAGIRTGEANAGDGDGLGRADGPVSKAGRFGKRQHVTGHLVGGCPGDGRRSRAVIDFVTAGIARSETFRCNSRAGAGCRAGQRVVAGVRAAEADAGDVDGLAGPGVLVGEIRRFRIAHAIAGNHIARRSAHGRRGGTVIGLVVAGVAHGEALPRDVGRGAGRRRGECVIAAVGAAQNDVGHAYRFARAHIPVGIAG